MTTGDRPVLAIVYGEGSVSAMKLKESAAEVCDLVWVVDSTEFTDPLMGRLLRKLGARLDIAGMSDDEAADALRALGPDGIVAYADQQMPTASALAERLELDYHDGAVTERLTDKVAQRTALGAGGLPVPRSALVPQTPTPGDIESLATGIEFPVVLKPRHGAASRDTILVDDLAHLGKVLAEASPSTADAMVIEEYLVGASPAPSAHFADYVSVESVVVAGEISHMAVTGRTMPDEPFRETGLVIPSDFSSSAVKAILEVATSAISALGVRTGFLHTEIKMTVAGPRVIEVNGRLGGFVPQVLALAAPGINLFEMSQQVALGSHFAFAEPVPTDRVGYVICEQPPQSAHHVARVGGLDRLAEFPGVDAVSLSRQPGDEVDWRKGSHEYVYSVLGAAPDYEGVLAVQQFIEEAVTVDYT
jgi:biotin carboxylase